MFTKKIKVEEVNYMPEPTEMQLGTLYISHTFKTAIHLCFCGCGIQSVTPLDDKNGWKLENENGITLHPSILNPCKSHYFITNSKINWL